VSEIAATRVTRILQTVVIIGTFGFGWWVTSKGLGISPDSVNYISSGLNLATGKGLITFTGAPLTVFPPGLPFLIASGHWLGISFQMTARLVNVLSVTGSVYLAMHIVERRVEKSAQVLLAGCIVGISFSGTYVATYVWTEPLFIFLVLLSFVAYLHFASRPSSRLALTLLGGTTAMAFAVRYVGLVLIPVFTLSIAWQLRNQGRRSIVNASSRVLFATSFVPTIWLIRNVATNGTVFGARPSSMQSLGTTLVSYFLQFLKLIFGTVFTSRVSDWSAVSLIALLLSAILASAWWTARFLPRAIHEMRSPSAVPLLVLFGVIYSGYLIFVQLTTAINPFDTRLLSPMYVPIILIAVFSVNSSRMLAQHISSNFRVVIGSLMLGLVLFCQITSTVAYSSSLKSSRFSGLATSPFEEAVMRIPASVNYYSNIGYLLWINHPRNGIMDAPIHGAYNSRDRYPISSTFLRSISCTPTLLVWSDLGPSWFYRPEELTKFVSVHLIQRFNDGAIYRLGPKGRRYPCSR